MSKMKAFHTQKGAGTKKLYLAFADWLKLDYFSYMEEREVLELVTCAQQTRVDWLTYAFLIWESQA